MARDDDELDRLLARGRLSGRQRDNVLDGAVRAAAPRRRGWRQLLAVLLPATAAALLLLLWPRQAFTPKGAPASTLLEVTCVDGARDRCRAGETLLFHVGGANQGGVLTAWAEPAGGGEAIWYFPPSDDRPLTVAATPAMQTLGRGVRLGPEQPPGAYVVHLVLTARPLTRAEARDARDRRDDGLLASTAVPLQVTK
jgi:hypothetical protein